MNFKWWKKNVYVDVLKKKKNFHNNKIFSQQRKNFFQHLVDLGEVEVEVEVDVEVVDDVEVVEVEVVDDVEVVEVEVVDEVEVFPINLPNQKTNYSSLLK